jgi:predicted nucleic acid-binding protein
VAKNASNGVVVETTILVDFLRGTSQASDYLDETRSQGRLFCSAVTAAELIVGARDRADLRRIRQLLTRFEVEAISADDSHRALRWLDRLFHSHGIGFHDCLIAAAAVRLHVPVATLNLKHFRSVPSVKIVRPY